MTNSQISETPEIVLTPDMLRAAADAAQRWPADGGWPCTVYFRAEINGGFVDSPSRVIARMMGKGGASPKYGTSEEHSIMDALETVAKSAGIGRDYLSEIDRGKGLAVALAFRSEANRMEGK